MGKLVHGLVAKFPIGFDTIVNALKDISIASNVYGEVFKTSPKVAIFIGEKYYFRAKSGLMAATIVIESSGGVIAKIIASDGRESFIDFFDLGASKSYAHKILDELADKLRLRQTIITEVNNLDCKKHINSMVYKTK